ncbi:pilus assembly PilX family protein [Chiayiivirga flava]|uniref:Tfp pilus assembly protein PilX n=1 Tax=Chiayiivirga flava TaxID=659595 RepID=A0A7W8G0U7_9GAMM|nr:PilX N-terminal domain-containing pilus assembly protein [Chiayiivirga flava]MBB5208148.1 Tfp pilus assembly protein PilX [Chiayiivirga flava]
MKQTDSRITVARQPAPRQRGSVLFLAMMLLIVLSLLALSVATVTGLQERMASTYRSEHLAFQHAEARLRATERTIVDETDPCHAGDPDPSTAWIDAPPASGTEHYRNMGRGPTARAFGWRGSSKAGSPALVGDIRCAYFEVSAIDFDVPGGDSTAAAVTTSVFVP